MKSTALVPKPQLLLLACLSFLLPAGTPPSAGEAVKRISFSYTLQNSRNSLSPATVMEVLAPLPRGPFQQVQHLQTSHPYEEVRDSAGNRLLRFSLGDFPPFSTKILRITAELAPGADEDRTRPPAEGEYLRPERFLESDTPEIVKLAETLKKPAPLDTARATLQWVKDNVRYTGTSGEARGALYAAKNKQGDCTEFATLFAALCRTNSIPARVVSGYLCLDNCVFKPEDYHDWTEIFLDGSWRFVDPQFSRFLEGANNYVALRRWSDASDELLGKDIRYRMQGEGVTVSMNR